MNVITVGLSICIIYALVGLFKEQKNDYRIGVLLMMFALSGVNIWLILLYFGMAIAWSAIYTKFAGYVLKDLGTDVFILLTVGLPFGALFMAVSLIYPGLCRFVAINGEKVGKETQGRIFEYFFFILICAFAISLRL